MRERGILDFTHLPSGGTPPREGPAPSAVEAPPEAPANGATSNPAPTEDSAPKKPPPGGNRGRILAALDERGAMKTLELASALNLPSQTVGAHLAVMRRLGWVAAAGGHRWRRAAPDEQDAAVRRVTPGSLEARALAVLSGTSGAVALPEVTRRLESNAGLAGFALSALVTRGFARRVKRGWYEITSAGEAADLGLELKEPADPSPKRKIEVELDPEQFDPAPEPAGSPHLHGQAADVVTEPDAGTGPHDSFVLVPRMPLRPLPKRTTAESLRHSLAMLREVVQPAADTRSRAQDPRLVKLALAQLHLEAALEEWG